MAKSVSKAVREILTGLSFLNYAFEKKLVNESSLARLIKERVEEKTGKQASLGSITAAVRRFVVSFKAKKQEKSFFEQLKSSRMLVRTGLVEVHFKRTQNTLERLAALEKQVNWLHGEKMYLLERSEELTIVAEKSFYEQILACAPNKNLLSKHDGRAIITIFFDPRFAEDSFGVFHFYAEQFASNAIPIHQIFSTYSAISFVIDEKNMPIAYKGLSNAINEIQAWPERYEKP